MKAGARASVGRLRAEPPSAYRARLPRSATTPEGTAPLSTDPLGRLRALCLALPEATEQEAWGAPTFRVRKKIFAMFADNHHRDGRVAVWCPAPVGIQQLLVRSDPDTYFVPPYVGVKGWIGIVIDGLDDEELREQIVQSYCMIAPKKLQALVDG